jgi:acetyl-CoA C-acetyltransferase
VNEVFIIGAKRTPIGNYGGTLKGFTAVELAKIAFESAINAAGIQKEDVSEVLLGNVFQAGNRPNPARQAAIKAAIPYEVPASTINKQCASGMKAVTFAAQSIMLGDADCMLAGGTESMSNIPYLLLGARWGYRMGDADLKDSMFWDGLHCAINDIHMGVTAENVAEKYGITRLEQDEIAVLSHQRAVRAMEEGRFNQEYAPVEIPQKKGESLIIDKDEHPMSDASMEKMAKLKPAFKKDGTVTAGNASGLNDAAAAMVLASEKFVKQNGLKPLGRIISFASHGVDPLYMGLGPIGASRKALAKANMSVGQMDLIESNEAFAAQAIAVSKELDFSPEKTNVNGGAIALGHPVGATGTRIIVSLIHELQRQKLKYGLATLCIGGGQGMTTVIEAF